MLSSLLITPLVFKFRKSGVDGNVWLADINLT
jgi:hypothetical protein